MVYGQSWLAQSRCGGINYTGHLTALMQDVVANVPSLRFIDLSRVLVFARPGRSSADGAYASCHSLGLPTTEPGYFFWRDRRSGEVTRRTEWFVTKSPTVSVDDKVMNYMISFALPRFMDQTLTRSRKRSLYPAGTPDWVAKLDTVIHELYHIDPAQNCLRRFARPDGSVSDALHSPTYFEDVAPLAIDEELMIMLEEEASCSIEGLASLSVGIEGPDGEVYRVIETQGLWETVRVFDALRARGLSITAGRTVGDRNLSRVFREA